MSEFLVIIPPGWIQLDWEYLSNNVPGMDVNAATTGVLTNMEEMLKTSGQIPMESSLLEFRLLDNAYFLIKLG
jgi:hypothetical protein